MNRFMNDATIVPAAMRDNPYPLYAMARQMAPVSFNETVQSWMVFGYEDARAILRDPVLFSSDTARFVDAESARRGRSILSMDPPRHDQLRSLVNLAFSARRVAGMEPRIRAIADELLDAVAPAGRMDLIDDLAYPLPVIVIAELLGVPARDRAVFKRWSDELAMQLGRLYLTEADMPDSLLTTERQFREYFEDQIEQHRQQPRDDLIGALLRAEIEGEKLTPLELLSFCGLLLVAGNETTTNLIGNGVRCLLENPAELERLRSGRSLVPSAVEEMLRYRSPAQAVLRFATEDTELHGQTVRAGQAVIVWLAAANRDPAEFADPERFDVARQPNRHIAFGLGVHFCLGAPLARLEANVALDALLARVPDIARAEDAPLEPIDSVVLQGIKHLPLTFRPPAPASAGTR